MEKEMVPKMRRIGNRAKYLIRSERVNGTILGGWGKYIYRAYQCIYSLLVNHDYNTCLPYVPYRDEEKNNPRIRPPYTPWWALGPPADMSGWKVAELRVEAEKRGLPHDGLKKGDLVEQLAKLNALYSLTGACLLNSWHDFPTYHSCYVIIPILYKLIL